MEATADEASTELERGSWEAGAKASGKASTRPEGLPTVSDQQEESSREGVEASGDCSSEITQHNTEQVPSSWQTNTEPCLSPLGQSNAGASATNASVSVDSVEASASLEVAQEDTLQSPVRQKKWKVRARDRARGATPSMAEITHSKPPSSSQTQSPGQSPKPSSSVHRRSRLSQPLFRMPSLAPPSAMPPSVLQSSQLQPPRTSLLAPDPPIFGESVEQDSATPHSFGDPEQAANSGSGTCGQPVVDSGSSCDEARHHDVAHGASDRPLHASDEACSAESEEDLSFSSPPPVSPSPSTKSPSHRVSKSGKPTRPRGRPPLHPSTTTKPSRGVKRSLPGVSSNPSTGLPNRGKRQRVSSNQTGFPTPANPLDPDVQHPPQRSPPQRSSLAGGFQATPCVEVPALGSPVPWLVPPESPGLLDALAKCKNGAKGASPAKEQARQKRTLQLLQNQVSKKLKTWGLHSHLLQEVDGHEEENITKHLVISEDQRDAFVKKMVESCRDNPQMRAKFLDSVKQLSEFGVLQTSACHLMAQGVCESSKEVVQAWKEMVMHPEGALTKRVELYKAVDKLHKQGDTAIRKLPWPEDTSMCSIGETCEGTLEIVIPVLASERRAAN